MKNVIGTWVRFPRGLTHFIVCLCRESIACPGASRRSMMEESNWQTQIQAFAESLDDLIAFADREEDFVLAATLESARIQFTDRYPHPGI